MKEFFKNPLVILGMTFIITIIVKIFEKEYDFIKKKNSQLGKSLKYYIWTYWKIFVFLVLPLVFLNFLFFTNIIETQISSSLMSVSFTILILMSGLSFLMTDKYNNIISSQNLKIKSLKTDSDKSIQYSPFLGQL